DAQIRRADLQRLLVRARARDAAGGDRFEPEIRQRPGAAQALQRQCRRGRPRQPVFAVRPGPRDLRRRQGRLRPARRRRIHPPQRAAATHARAAAAKAEAVSRGAIKISADRRPPVYPESNQVRSRARLHPAARRPDRAGAVAPAWASVFGPALWACRYSSDSVLPFQRSHRSSTVTLRFSPRFGFSPVSRALTNSKTATALLDGPSHNSAVSGVTFSTQTFGSSGPRHHTLSVDFQIAAACL